MEILEYLGKFHPVILHLPIGALYLTFCLVLLQKFFNNNYTIPVRFGLLFSFAFSVISALLGYFLYLGDDFSGDLIELHMWLGISTTIFIGILLWMHKTSTYLKYFDIFFLITIILLSVTGHFGGQITHGKDYLKIPEFSQPSVKTSVDSINVFSSVVMPVLENKCVKCHNPNKYKGGLMMHSQEAILKGGERGPLFVSFDPNSSRLYNYPKLPMNDKLHMPPEGNSQLTENEVEILRIWIEGGGQFDKFSKTESFNELDKEILTSFFPNEIKVDPPRKQDLEKLIELGFRLERNSISNNYIEAKFLGDKLSSKHMSALRSVKSQLIKLDLSHSNFNDRFLSKLSSFENLKYLKINDTEITDKGLSYIGSSVKSLNLNNNDIGLNSVKILLENSNLKTVYLWNVNIDSESQEILKNSNTALLNFGVTDFGKGVPLSSPKPISEQTMFSDSLKIEFYKPLGNPEIRYTLNGDEPDSLSILYEKPFTIKQSLTLKAKAFKQGWLDSKIGIIDYVKVEGVIKDYVLKTMPDNRYSHPKKLFDGIIGDLDFRDGYWNGFIRTKDYQEGVNERNSGDLVLEIDMEGKDYSSIGFHSLEDLGSYIMFPKRIELYDISKLVEKLIYFEDIPESELGAANLTKFFKIPITQKTSKLKLVVKSNKKLPKNHPAEGQYAWLFVDEILFL